MTDYTKEEIKKDLKKFIKPSSKLSINITKVSRSGMTRRMLVYAMKGTELINITWDISKLCELSENDEGIKVTGCGMDMAFWLVDDITLQLYGNKKPKGLKGNGGKSLDWQIL